MAKEVIQLAILWNFTKSECIAINQSLQMYIATKENDFMLGLDPISFWKITSNFDSSLRHLATMIFKIKGHDALVETLFSGSNIHLQTLVNCNTLRFSKIPPNGQLNHFFCHPICTIDFDRLKFQYWGHINIEMGKME